MGIIMKFEKVYLLQQCEVLKCGKTIIERASLGKCQACGSFTAWEDTKLNIHVCSEECCSSIWSDELRKDPETLKSQIYATYADQIKYEQECIAKCKGDFSKDIIIIVRDQLNYIKTCISSIQKFTKNYRLLIWDNGSQEETNQYLESLISDVVLVRRSEENLGFIEPNNELSKLVKSDYVILLNSDTIVSEGWDDALIGFMRYHDDIKAIGYLGGILDENGFGCSGNFGRDIDYVAGWCLCFEKEILDRFGLFDERLRFAYCEDSDFCLRLVESGFAIYALHIPLVHHYGNVTAVQVAKERNITETFKVNHEFMRERWKHYLKNERIQVRATHDYYN